MKKLSLGIALALALILVFPSTVSAQNPCGGICQAYYPCDYPCDLCVGDPGLWDGSYCWGEMVSGTCGDIGQCGWQPCTPQWSYDEWASYQGVKPEFSWDPCYWDWQWNPATGWEYVEICDYNNPYKCTVYGIHRYVRHQDNCPPSSSETFCLLNNNGSERFIGRYPAPWGWQCCNDANVWDCYEDFPQCPNL